MTPDMAEELELDSVPEEISWTGTLMDDNDRKEKEIIYHGKYL